MLTTRNPSWRQRTISIWVSSREKVWFGTNPHVWRVWRYRFSFLAWPTWQGWICSATRWFCHVCLQQNKDIKRYTLTHTHLSISSGMKIAETLPWMSKHLLKCKRSTVASYLVHSVFLLLRALHEGYCRHSAVNLLIPVVGEKSVFAKWQFVAATPKCSLEETLPVADPGHPTSLTSCGLSFWPAQGKDLGVWADAWG